MTLLYAQTHFLNEPKKKGNTALYISQQTVEHATECRLRESTQLYQRNISTKDSEIPIQKQNQMENSKTQPLLEARGWYNTEQGNKTF
jgi:hypothetical protein